jgi:serine phosphatase RsbU (regulator of sigma subunit)/class 3 adenylate cyclase
MAMPVGSRFCLNCGQPVGERTPIDETHLINLASSAPPPLVEKVRAAANLTGERRLVTAVFIDIVNSTALSERVGSASWSTIMGKSCDWFCSVIYRYEGTIARFVGDELLAFFGAPVAHEDDPVRAVHAALEILDTVIQRAANIRQDFEVDFDIRISLSTGPVTIGPVSRDLQFEYSALEGTLNLAAQLEATKQSMAVLVSEETYRLVAPFFNCIDLGAMDIKGQTEPVHIYQVSGAKADTAQTRGLIGLESPMVGRDSELQVLLQLSEAVAAGLGRAVLIVGESGLGKTRLIAEWKPAIAQSNHQSPLHALAEAGSARGSLQWAEGHCLSFSQGIAYHLLRDLLRSLIGVSATASEPETRAALRSLSTQLFGDSALNVYPYLGHLLSFVLEDEALERIQPLDPPALQAQYLSACKRLLLALAARSPLVLLLEDLQWADPSSTAILSQLLPLAATTPLLFCLVSRPHRDTPGWKLVTASRQTMGGRFSELRLNTLSETDSRQIISNLLQIDALPENVQHLILKKAEGNPLFIEEVLRMMIDQGAIQSQNGGWVTRGEIATIGIPNNLRGLLLASLDRLPDEAKQTLRVAAVIGRQFPLRVLEQVISNGQGGMALINHLGDLESTGLIDVFQVKPELAYRFRNTLLQDVVYASLLTADRQRLHLAVGAAMERLYLQKLEQISPQLAHHFLVAGDNACALKYFSLAGDTALNAYANQEAESHYRQALDLVPASSEQATLVFKLGQALYWQSRFQDAIQVWREGINLFQELGDSDGVARLYARSARAAWNAGDTPGGLKLCQEGLAAVTPHTEPGPAKARGGDPPTSSGLALLLHEAARAHLFNGLAAEARQLCQRALDMAKRLGDITVQAEALATLGLLPDQPPEAALAALRMAAELAESGGLLSQAARAHVNLAALMATDMPNFESARDHYRQAAELQRLRGNPAGELLGLGGMVGVLLESGNFEEVEATLPVMRQLLNELAYPGPAAFHIRISEALLRRYRGELAEAAQMLLALQTEERQRGNLQNLMDIDVHLAEIVLESRDFPDQAGAGIDEWVDAEAALAEAIEICDRWSAGGIRPRCLLGMVYIGQGQFDDARRLLSEAQNRVGTQLAAPDEGWPSIAEARLAAADARWPEALALFETAAGTYARLGMRWQRARVLLEWAEAHSSRREPTDLEQARALLQEASSLFAGMGISFYSNLAKDRLQTLEVESYAQALAHQNVDQEMAAARKIQTGFLPAKTPQIPGWQLAAALEPSRQTSGDFYDFIPLSDGRLGVVIADVADKGAAAALFMALSSSLIRTYAAGYETQPELVLGETNRRILADTHTDLFVTVFYAVLDPATGTLLYSNAGHNPPYHFQQERGTVRPLTRTGMPVGIFEDSTWAMGTVQISPGDVLVLYTDGVTDAQDGQGAFFSSKQLLATVQSNLRRPAQEIQEAILTTIHQFAGGVPQFDDITLVVLAREAA